MSAGLFNFDQLKFRYEPFPIGLARPLMDEGLWREFVPAFPSQEMFADLSMAGYKYSLSEKSNPRIYRQPLHTRPVNISRKYGWRG